jgi:Rrf2 family protein
MLELGRRPHETVPGADLARATDIPSRFITQVMSDLVRAGLVESTIGRRGGYRLVMKTTDVSILAIVEAIEGDTRRRTCVLSSRPCSRENSCEIHAIFTAGQQALIGELARATLDEALSREVSASPS